MTLEEYKAALARGPVTYHKTHCPAAASLGEFPCDLNICGAAVEHERKLRGAAAAHVPV